MGWFEERLARNRAVCLGIRSFWYPEQEWPGEIYLAEIRAHPGDALLEIGCGRGAEILSRAADSFQLNVGVDPECEGVSVPGDRSIELIAGDARRIPFADGTFDVVAMQNVAEHFLNPPAVFHECARVLRPGGYLIVQTVNKYFPPVFLARSLPHRARVILNRILSGRADEDTFPAYYRANTMRALRRLGAGARLRVQRMEYLPHHPAYLLCSPLVYRAAVLLERGWRRLGVLKGLRHFLHVVYTKPGLAPMHRNFG